MHQISACITGHLRNFRFGRCKKKAPLENKWGFSFNPGSDLLSHGLTTIVSSTQEGLTSVFGMGTGIAPPVLPPGNLLSKQIPNIPKANINGQAARPISTGKLNTLLCLHIQPINLVVYQGPLVRLRRGISNLGVGFPLRCLQRLSLPDITTQRCHWRDNWHIRGPSIPVLSY